MILVINAGSSSIKFSIFDRSAAENVVCLKMKGHVAQVGATVELQINDAQGLLLTHSVNTLAHDGFDHDVAMSQILAWLDKHPVAWFFEAIGHRVVHGGQQYLNPVEITDDVMCDLDRLVPLAPLHQPHNLKVIRLLRARWPSIVQVACFDTAFHVTQSDLAQACALPRAITAAGVRRYGFHGLSYEYIASQLPRVLGTRAEGKVIVAHLGNGASMCALVHRKSIASTMGFSALDGLVMGTRSGSLDPGIVLYFLQEFDMSAEQVSDLLYNQSGLLGVSGISSDMHVLLDSEEPFAAQAIDLFVYRIVCDIGALAAAMGGIDALVFTAGIGEHAALIRERICQGSTWLGADLDKEANNLGQEHIQLASSKMQLVIIPTDEEQMIASHTYKLVANLSTVV